MSSKTFGDLVGLTSLVLVANRKKDTSKRETNTIDRVKTVMIYEDGETIVEYKSGTVEHY